MGCVPEVASWTHQLAHWLHRLPIGEVEKDSQVAEWANVEYIWRNARMLSTYRFESCPDYECRSSRLVY